MNTEIIIPVYNGLESLERCIESVFAHTPADTTIRVGDDASTDDRVGTYLEELERSHPRVKVTTNANNLGFVGNVNALIEQSSSDVIILNSDTIVTEGWFDEILNAAAASHRVGSVTPLSNNAEIASVPQIVASNVYPSHITIADLGDIAATSGSGEIIEIPTAVGFCMWLRRTALDEVGLLNESLFGKGYGEENDLSLRMRNRGWLNVLCDRAFVHHTGGVSFSSAGTDNLQENLKILGEHWPKYHKTIARFIKKNPLRGVDARFGAELLRRTKTEKRRVLFLLHNPLFGKAIGGTEFQTLDLVNGLGGEVEPLILYPGGRGLDLQWIHDSARLTFPATANRQESTERGWAERLLDTGIDVIHVQHSMRFTASEIDSLLAAARDRGIEVIWSLHDYYVLCPAAQLLDAESAVPCVSLDGTGSCDGCEARAERLEACSVAEWRITYARWLADGFAVVVPSEAAKRVIGGVMPNVEISVIPHGLDAQARSVEPKTNSPVRLGVLGYAGVHKGDREVAALIEASSALDIEWHFFGRVSAPEGLSADALRRTVVHGRYDRGVLPELLIESGIHATVLLSPWPETYSYTLTESWLAGLPAFASNQGALAERIERSGAGIVFRSEDPRSMAQSIADTLEDSAVMKTMRELAVEAATEIPAITDMAARYAELYRAAGSVRDASAEPAPVVLSVPELVDLVAALPVIEPAIAPA